MIAPVATTTETDLRALIVRCRESRDRGRDWILAHLDSDGKPAGAEMRQCYYRVPWTLAAVGEEETAATVLAWIEQHALTPGGDLVEGAPRDAFTTRAASYPLAIIAMGAAHLERDDVARRIMDTLRNFQDPGAGGTYSERLEVRTSYRQDLYPTAQLGMTGLTAGRLDVAEGAFKWIKQLYSWQPELPHRLFTATTSDGLLTDPPPDLEWLTVTDFSKPRQAFFNPGIAAAFLARYFMRTGDTEARELGAKYLDLSIGGTDAQFDYTESKQICKFGWGAALMALADPDGGHLRHVVRMAEWFIAGQLPPGNWHNSPFLAPTPSQGDDLEITAEFVLQLSTILVALGSRVG
jgi:hypothetical protein